MTHDPFGNLTNWGPVLDTIEELACKGDLSECQSGLIRILRFRGNWRLREEVLKCAGEIRSPSNELIHQVISILDDDNIYYDARILACEALVQLLERVQDDDEVSDRARKVIDKLKRTLQPPYFDKALDRLSAKHSAQRFLES